jgi:molecular chaperone GrpE (heat shock protein)
MLPGAPEHLMFVPREVRRGWQLGDEVLRPAQVVVATAREVDDPWR